MFIFQSRPYIPYKYVTQISKLVTFRNVNASGSTPTFAIPEHRPSGVSIFFELQRKSNSINYRNRQDIIFGLEASKDVPYVRSNKVTT